MTQAINTLKAGLPPGGLEREGAEAVNSKQARSLYAARVKIHPKAAHGFFRRIHGANSGRTKA